MKASMLEQREFWTTEETADWLRRPEATLRGWRCRQVGPPWVKVGGRVVYRQTEVRRWIDQQAAESQQRRPVA